VGGAKLYQSQTARVIASVQPLIASGPQFHLQIRDANLGPFQGSSGAVLGLMLAYYVTIFSGEESSVPRLPGLMS
jgi:hypothetical protein